MPSSIRTDTPFTVLGAGGFVGGHLVRWLQARGIACAALGRDDDWRDRDLGHAVYCIGLTQDFGKRPFDTVAAHVSLFSDLVKGGRFRSLTYLSSTRLYDSGGGGRETDDLVLNPGNPRHLYDFTKAVAESLCITGGRENVRALRLSCVYGDDLGSVNFLHHLVRRARVEASFRLEAHPDGARDYIHVDDVSAAIFAAATAGRRPLYNVASGENLPNRDLIPLVEQLFGTSITLVPPESAPAASPQVDISALRRELGVAPRSVAQALSAIAPRRRAAAAE